MSCAAWPTSDLRRVARKLRCHAPAGDVVVRRHFSKAYGGDLGRAWLRPDGTAMISIARNLPAEAAVDTLVHEWGHVLAWRRYGDDVDDHGPEWGMCMAEAFVASRRDV